MTPEQKTILVEKLDKMNGVLSVLSFSVEWAAFNALRDCISSKLQLLH